MVSKSESRAEAVEVQAATAGSATGTGGDTATRTFRGTQSFEVSESDRAQDSPGVAGQGDKTVISHRPAAGPQEFYRQVPLPDLAAMLEGHTLDHFQVLQIIGGGGMGAVFRGLDQRLNRTVAIKVMPGFRRDAESLRRFRTEAQSAARLDHPNIARVYYVGEAEQWNYIVFEYIDGVNIRDLVENQGPLSIDDAVFYTRQIAEALQHAHDRAVVHRDIKPSNILVTAGGIAKLVDMGLARDTSIDSSTADQTASGVTLGTFDYISPEQARNPRDADVRSDLYSLGCSLFFMLTGRPPFPEGTALQKLLNHGSLPPPDPRESRDDISDQLYEILMKLMAKRAGDRYQKPIELINDLMLLAEQEGLSRSQGPTTISFTPTLVEPTLIETHLPWLIAVAVLLASTIWMQQQSMSRSFTLPEVNFTEVRNHTDKDQQLRQNAPQSSIAQAQPAPSTASRDSTLRSLPGDSIISPADSVMPAVSGPVVGNSAESASNRIPTDPQRPFGDNSRSSSSSTEPLITDGPTINGLDSPPALTIDALDNPGATVSSPATSDSPTAALTASAATIVVSTVPPTDVKAEFWEASLARAVKRAAELPQPAMIEVRGSVWLDRPLEIRGSADIVIRSSASEIGRVEVARGLWSNLNPQEGAINVVDANLTLQDIKLQAAFSGTPAKPMNIFQVRGNARLMAQQCEFTVRSDSTSTVGLIAVGPGENSTSTTMTSPQQRPARSTRFALERSLVRGGCSVFIINQIGSNTQDAIQINIDSSAIAVDGSALELFAPTSTAGVQRILRMYGQSSTFVTGREFAALQYVGTQLPTVGFSRTSQACVFSSLQAQAHIAIRGEAVGLSSNPDLLLLQGLDNAYDVGIESICQLQKPMGRADEFAFQDAQQAGWLLERGTEHVVRWKNPGLYAGRLADADWSDFRLAEAYFVPGVPATQLPGF
ncbi:MAG: serine/threonine protein kinase [Pirellulaceae bacterium]|nr:serine/threonine protein kinase [Pirellulaceae bacterium]